MTLVFDRGIISDENGALIEDANMKYISALDRNQIPSCGVSLEAFKGLEISKTDGTIPLPGGFDKYDNQLYFQNAGVIGDKRYILGFNPCLFEQDRINREEKIAQFEIYLKEENKDLRKAKRDRDLEVTKSIIVNELRGLKIKKYFETPILEPTTVHARFKGGDTETVNSFKARAQKKQDIIEADKLLDGVCVFLTNHTDKLGRGFKAKPQTIIKDIGTKSRSRMFLKM